MPAINSGNEVPIETMVNPITRSEIFNFFAISFAPSTIHSEP
tara:strand:- start:414 stop:539 length:126 start_codon:yes stop_codon:yes gene_type:complete